MPGSTDISLFYTSYPDEATAEKISTILLEEKLIACSNIFPVVKSQYWWEGKIESSKESVAILKTQRSKAEALKNRFLDLHPYEVPCFLEIAIDSGNIEYLKWLRESLR